MSRYTSTGEAARALGISPATLTRWVKAGIVTPAETTGGGGKGPGHYRWDMTSLRAQVRRHRLGHRMTPEDIAYVLYEANRAVQVIQGDPRPSPSWEDAPEYQVRETVASVNEALADPGRTPEQNHEGWCERLRADGWVHGEVKDAERKTHPTLVPFGDLPVEQQLKDRLFIAVVRALTPERSFNSA